MNYVRRFVFVHYDDLLNIRFKKLEKVTDKLYVFTPSTVSSVPIWLVRQMQNMGPDLEWIDIDDADRESATRIMCFQLGVLHEKVDLGVEFAILSDDDRLDDFIEHVHTGGRSCVRVRQNAQGEDSENGGEDFEEDDLDEEHDNDMSQEINGLAEVSETVTHRRPAMSAAEHDLRESTFALKTSGKQISDSRRTNLRQPLRKETGNGAQVAADEPNENERVSREVANLADDLVRMLIRSGNRPNNLSMLRSYILLHSDEADAVRHVDGIIKHMEQKGEIQLSDDSISYNF